MPIAEEWLSYKKELISKILDKYGVYELADESKVVIYIGEGKLNDRLLAHATESRDDYIPASYFRYEITGSKTLGEFMEKELLDNNNNNGNLSKYNEQRHA